MKTQRTLPMPDPESEDFVRQYVLRLLISTFGYAAADIECEFPIHIGSKRVYVDIAVFPRGARHTQKNIAILLDCKPMDFQKQEAALRQVLWFMSACEGVKYGVLATERWTVLDKHMAGDSGEPPIVPALVGASGDPVVIVYDPRRQTVTPNNVPAPAAKPASRPATRAARPADEDLAADLPRPRRFRMAFRLVGASTMLLALLFALAIALPGFNPAERLSLLTGSSPDLPTVNPQIAEISPTVAAPVTAQDDAPAEESAALLTYQGRAVSDKLFGIVQVSDPINVRREASMGSAVVTVLYPDDRVEIIGVNEDESWLNVRLEDRTEGWVAAFLIELER